MIERHLKPALGAIRPSDLRAGHIHQYYASKTLSGATLSALHQAVLHRALKDAVQQDLIQRNPASLVIGKPRARAKHDEARLNCWEADEARRFLAYVQGRTPQIAALYTLALETGMRKGELFGLKWGKRRFRA